MLARHSRFKSYLILPEAWREEAQRLAPQLHALRSLSESQVSPAERIFLFILLYLEARAPGRWWMSAQKASVGVAGSSWRERAVLFPFLESFPVRDWQDWLVQYRVKKLPVSIFESLVGKERHTHLWILQEKAVSPREMLAWQARGERVVTLAWEEAIAGAAVDEGRDAFEFLLHDLVHADLFFRDRQSYRDQKEFFAGLHRQVDGSFYQKACGRDAEFGRDLDYLMSDMNSHLAHLQCQLEAILIKYLRKTEGAAPGQLSPEGYQQLLSLCDAVKCSSAGAAMTKVGAEGAVTPFNVISDW